MQVVVAIHDAASVDTSSNNSFTVFLLYALAFLVQITNLAFISWPFYLTERSFLKGLINVHDGVIFRFAPLRGYSTFYYLAV